jgi:hypothetical protein
MKSAVAMNGASVAAALAEQGSEQAADTVCDKINQAFASRRSDVAHAIERRAAHAFERATTELCGGIRHA